mgnify:CR=1 FL=1
MRVEFFEGFLYLVCVSWFHHAVHGNTEADSTGVSGVVFGVVFGAGAGSGIGSGEDAGDSSVACGEVACGDLGALITGNFGTGTE